MGQLGGSGGLLGHGKVGQVFQVGHMGQVYQVAGESVHSTGRGCSLGSNGKVGHKGLKGPSCMERWARLVR
jgi:hypothetical protein